MLRIGASAQHASPRGGDGGEKLTGAFFGYLMEISWNEDPNATVLGEIVYTLGRCRPSFAVKTFNPGTPEQSWTSVYSAVPNIPSQVLRGIAGSAGVHLYNEDGDVLHATPDLLAVHTVAGGKRIFKLPRQVEVVYDLFQERVLARDSNHFEVTLSSASSAFFYTGKDADLP